MKQMLSQKLQQKLSPLQIQVIKLLEIPVAQLDERIKEEIEENPTLEYEEGPKDEEQREEKEPKEAEDISIEDYIQNDDIPTYKLQGSNRSADDNKHEEIPFSVGTTFYEYLQDQLGIQNLNERQTAIAEYIIGSIDEDGYLRRSVSEMADDMAFTQNLEVKDEEVKEVLHIVQQFDPPGIGGMNLQESLVLQLERKDMNDLAIQRAHKILTQYFDEFSKRHFEKIAKRMHLEDEELKEAVEEILHLNPKPGSSYSNPLQKSVFHIIPDFILELEDNQLYLSLNSRNVPELRVSAAYQEMLEEYSTNKKNNSKEQKEAVMFVKQKLDSAKWFIDAIKQRNDTLMTTMQAILDYQREYFMDGDETKLRPMILKNIAEITGYDISTISRVSNSKYIQTHFGIFPLKYFFSEAMQTDTGEEVSTREIKKILQECIANEDKRKPVTDEKLALILKEKSYIVARRTVAKYREQLGIPVARLRKEL